MLDLVSRLAAVKTFAGLPVADLRAIVMAGQIRRYPAGTTIFLEGEPCAGFFAVLSGRVHLRKADEHGHEKIIGVIEPVIPLNAAAAVDGGPNPATAIAVQDCVAWHMDHQALQDMLQRYPQIGLGLLRVLAARTRLLVTSYRDLSFLSVRGRTAKLLLDLSDNGRRPIDRHQHPGRDLAARVGIAPETFSRSLSALCESGLIVCNRSNITVSRPEDLARLAQVDASVPQELASSIAL